MTSPVPDDSAALKPCPCCRSAAELGQLPFEEDSPDAGGYFIRCTNEACLIGMGLRFACGDDPRPELIAAWNRRADADGWQPISTVPKDDTIVLAASPRDGGEWLMMPVRGAMLFRNTQGPTPQHLRFDATHWRPLPPVPEASR